VNSQQSDNETLMTFPCEIGIKAMGLATDEFLASVKEIIKANCEQSAQISFSVRASNGGKYHSVTATITATGRGQLDKIYQALTDCPNVVMTL
jgi:uncharacterized protein